MARGAGIGTLKLEGRPTREVSIGVGMALIEEQMWVQELLTEAVRTLSHLACFPVNSELTVRVLKDGGAERREGCCPERPHTAVLPLSSLCKSSGEKSKDSPPAPIRKMALQLSSC